MQRAFLTILLGAALAACTTAAPRPAVPETPAMPDTIAGQKACRLDKKVEVECALQYLLYLPPTYEAEPDRRWPLLLFLHGAGERGDNLERVTIHGPGKHIREGREFPFIIVSPQCPEGRVWRSDELLVLLDEVEATHRVDKARVYVTGLSMGGFGTWDLAAREPKRFAAVAPICGGTSWINLWALREIPIWAFHGAKDPVVALEQSELPIEFLKEEGADARLTIYPEAGHDSWSVPYAGTELYDWFLSHHR